MYFTLDLGLDLHISVQGIYVISYQSVWLSLLLEIF